MTRMKKIGMVAVAVVLLDLAMSFLFASVVAHQYGNELAGMLRNAADHLEQIAGSVK